MHTQYLSALLTLLPLAASHGLITNPPSRATGPAINSTCGPLVTANINADNTSHVEGLPELAAKDPIYKAKSCNLWQCKGLQFADNVKNVQSWTAGQVIPISVYLRIPHLGYANVSIVDTASNTIIGEQLKVWASGYAPGTRPTDPPLDQREFNVTVPAGLEDKCAEAGACVLQWWWYGTGAKQTYESCVDFKIEDEKSDDEEDVKKVRKAFRA